MSITQIDTVNLSDISTGKLPGHIIDEISKMNISLKELSDWETEKESWNVYRDKGKICISVKFRLPIMKMIGFLSGIVTLIWLLIKYQEPILYFIKKFTKL